MSVHPNSTKERQHGNEQHVAREVEKMEEEKRTLFARWKK